MLTTMQAMKEKISYLEELVYDLDMEILTLKGYREK